MSYLSIYSSIYLSISISIYIERKSTLPRCARVPFEYEPSVNSRYPGGEIALLLYNSGENLSLSIFISIYLSISISIYLSMYLSIHIYTGLTRNIYAYLWRSSRVAKSRFCYTILERISLTLCPPPSPASLSLSLSHTDTPHLRENKLINIPSTITKREQFSVKHLYLQPIFEIHMCKYICIYIYVYMCVYIYM